MGLWKRLARFAAALANDQGFEYEAGGITISCPRCGNTKFHKSKAQLNTKEMTLWGLDFLDRSAKILHCRQCGYIRWFGKPLLNRTLSRSEA